MWAGAAAEESAPPAEPSSVCRGCMMTGDSLTALSSDAVRLYAFCTSIEILEHEMLPKTFCGVCFDSLNKFATFKEQCLRTNRTLIQCMEPTEKSDEDEFNKTEELLDDDDLFDQPLFTANTDEGESMFPDHSSKHIRRSTKLKKKKKLKSDKKQFKIILKKKYIDKKHINFEYACLLCSKKFAYPERLEAHKLSHDGVKEEILCQICNKKFKQWDGLRRHHEFVHMTFGKTLECDTCGKLFKTSMTLRNHQKIHQERKDYVCHICGGSYRSGVGLQNHLDTHNENREKKHECNICGKKFVSSNYLTSHMFRHKERRFVCNVCRFPFFTKADLTRHMLIHNGIKPYVCEICNKAYSTKSFLIEHGRMHSGEKPFSCDYCSMTFISKRRLIDHRRTHTGEKPHKCDKCNQAFIQRGSLTRHLKVHEKRRGAEGATDPTLTITQCMLIKTTDKDYNVSDIPAAM